MIVIDLMAGLNFFKVSKFLLYLALFSIILVGTETLFPFIVLKYAFFRTAIILALVFFAVGLSFHSNEVQFRYLGSRAFEILKSPLVIAVSIFVLIFLLASFFAVDPQAAFWSDFERGEGGIQLLNFFIFFILLVLLFRTEKDWQNFFRVSLAAAGLMIFYGVLAHFGVPGFIGSKISFGSRFYGSLGNPAYVGTYLMFIIGFGAYLFAVNTKRSAKFWLAGLLAFYFIFFLLAQVRGAVIGLAAGVFAFLLYWAWHGSRRRSLLTAVVLAAAILFIIFARLDYFNLPPWLNRLVNIDLGSTSFQTRIWTWQTAVKGWQERPILGWGPENFAVVFDSHFDTRHYIPDLPKEFVETWYDRAHNLFLDYLAATGLLGLLSFLAIFVVFYWQFSKTKDFPGRAVVFALPIAYLVQGIVIFDVLPIYLNLFLLLGFAAYKFQNSKLEIEN